MLHLYHLTLCTELVQIKPFNHSLIPHCNAAALSGPQADLYSMESIESIGLFRTSIDDMAVPGTFFFPLFLFFLFLFFTVNQNPLFIPLTGTTLVSFFLSKCTHTHPYIHSQTTLLSGSDCVYLNCLLVLWSRPSVLRHVLLHPIPLCWSNLFTSPVPFPHLP